MELFKIQVEMVFQQLEMLMVWEWILNSESTGAVDLAQLEFKVAGQVHKLIE